MPPAPKIMTAEGLDALRVELAELEGPARREIAARIKVAREWGDLSENAEYHDAKNSQAMLEGRIARLADELRSAQVVDPGANTGEVAFGSAVELRDDASGRTVSYTLVGSREADLDQGRLSIESPVARALLGHRAGDKVEVGTPRGARVFEVLRVGA